MASRPQMIAAARVGMATVMESRVARAENPEALAEWIPILVPIFTNLLENGGCSCLGASRLERAIQDESRMARAYVTRKARKAVDREYKRLKRIRHVRHKADRLKQLRTPLTDALHDSFFEYAHSQPSQVSALLRI